MLYILATTNLLLLYKFLFILYYKTQFCKSLYYNNILFYKQITEYE